MVGNPQAPSDTPVDQAEPGTDSSKVDAGLFSGPDYSLVQSLSLPKSHKQDSTNRALNLERKLDSGGRMSRRQIIRTRNWWMGGISRFLRLADIFSPDDRGSLFHRSLDVILSEFYYLNLSATV
jgi:hypothetical protein